MPALFVCCQWEKSDPTLKKYLTANGGMLNDINRRPGRQSLKSLIDLFAFNFKQYKNINKKTKFKKLRQLNTVHFIIFSKHIQISNLYI